MNKCFNGESQNRITIFTENPEEDLWKTILQYTYKSHIANYFSTNNLEPENQEELCEIISGSLLQANEYYQLSKTASLHVAPLLLYYGTINLALGTLTLIKGQKFNIENHGIKINTEPGNDIGSTKIHFFNPDKGGIHIFLKNFDTDFKLAQLDDWNIKELLLSIPEINIEAKQCYKSVETFCYQLKSIITENGVIEKIQIEQEDKHTIANIFQSIPKFSSSYLRPNFEKDKENYITLRHKYLSESIDVKAHSGQSFLIKGHMKRGQLIVLPQWAYMYITLFSLGSLCRYNPEKWNPFIRLDESGEKLLIEKFLNLSRRLLPNIFLSKICKCDYVFENKKYSPENKINIIGEHEIKELIQSQIQELIINRGN